MTAGLSAAYDIWAVAQVVNGPRDRILAFFSSRQLAAITRDDPRAQKHPKRASGDDVRRTTRGRLAPQVRVRARSRGIAPRFPTRRSSPAGTPANSPRCRRRDGGRAAVARRRRPQQRWRGSDFIVPQPNEARGGLFERGSSPASNWADGNDRRGLDQWR